MLRWTEMWQWIFSVVTLATNCFLHYLSSHVTVCYVSSKTINDITATTSVTRQWRPLRRRRRRVLTEIFLQFFLRIVTKVVAAADKQIHTQTHTRLNNEMTLIVGNCNSEHGIRLFIKQETIVVKEQLQSKSRTRLPTTSGLWHACTAVATHVKTRVAGRYLTRV